MADRSIKMVLRAEVSDFNRQVGSAAKSLDDLAKKAGGSEKVAQTTMGRLAQSAQLQRESWDKVGTTLLTVGTAVTALGTAAMVTGINYNQMQQSSRAALTTLLGSAEAANAQMDKLDDFARTSPFAKQVFIQAQQQMLGFGIEAQKVIPYLDAIQNAVAATGGSNQDIAELTRIFSQVQAAAKITAVDLMQFGQRGVDAATLIGSQMGMTGVEIREQITAGTLDAGQALDALATGMQERFGGAADNVKNTFAGAVDRVKAAWRDLSSELAEPLVGMESGGLAVSGLNALADAMREFQDAPGWVKGATVALGGLTGAVSLGGAALFLGLPRYMEFRTALSQLAEISPRTTAALGKVGGAASVAAASLTAVWAAAEIQGRLGAMQVATVEVGELADELVRLADEADAVGPALAGIFENQQAVANFPWVKDIEDAQDAVDAFASSAREAFGQDFNDRVDRLISASGDIGRFTKQAEQLDAAFAQMVADGNADQAAEMYERFTQAAIDQNVPLDVLTDAFPEYQAAAEDAAVAAANAAPKYDLTTDAVDRQILSMEDLLDLQRTAAGEAMSLAESQGAWAQQVMDNNAIQEEFNRLVAEGGAATNAAGTELDLYTQAGQFANQTLIDTASAGWGVVESLVANKASTEEVRAATQTARDEFIRVATQMGLTQGAAAALADQYGLVPEEVNTEASLRKAQAEADLASLRAKYDALPRHIQTNVSLSGYATTYQYLSNIQSIIRGLDGSHARVSVGAGGQGGITFADGGYTGDGGKHDPAGIVHKGEFVTTKERTAQYRPVLESIHRGTFRLPGYAYGGFVGASRASVPSVSVGSPDVAVYVQSPVDGAWVRSEARVVVKESQRAEDLAGPRGGF